jgi:RecB family endonuclease NucS
MTPIFERLFKTSHDGMVKAVNEALDLEGWQVEVEPIVGNVRPDIVAREPNDGMSYVIEIKDGDLEANLGAVAQVETFRNAVAEHRGGAVKGMLVVTGEAQQDLSAIARSANVELVQAESSDTAEVLESLKRAGLGESTVA